MVRSQPTVPFGTQSPVDPARRRRALCGLALGTAAALGAVAVAGAQDANPADTYALLLQQTSDVNTNVLRQEFLVTQQQAEIDRLSAALEEANATDSEVSLLPMVREMVAQLEAVMVEDLPFRVEARFAALDNLRETIGNDEAEPYDAFRRALDLAEDEVTLGLSVGAYTGNNPVNPGQRFAACQQDPLSARCDLSDEQRLALENDVTVEDFNQLGQLPDGNYIHYGRMALMYLERDSSEGFRYDAASKQWEALPNRELLNLRQDVRIARGESAITTMTAPISVGAAPSDAS